MSQKADSLFSLKLIGPLLMQSVYKDKTIDSSYKVDNYLSLLLMRQRGEDQTQDEIAL